MSQLALARRYRPRDFQSVIGQEVVLRALISALETQRLHHAYLLTGMRGVGKTSIARILAKCLNCEIAISSTPCGKCSACQSIDAGSLSDLIEIDAASRTKVEDMRELLDNVQYLPTQARFKIYLIDEVHMLSVHSFNALLKTLEEPPAHVKFILATTDPQKLPATILSRCLQFHLPRLPFSQIVNHLMTLLNQEGVPFERPALEELARAAEGSMRDALSLLDQSLAYGRGRIQTVDIRTLLGLTEKGRLVQLLSEMLEDNAVQVFKEINEIANQSSDFSAVLVELITLIHHIAIAQKVPEALDDSILERDAILDLAARVTPEEVQLYYQIALLGQRDLPYAPTPRMGFEMVLLRMLAFQPIRIEEPEKPPSAFNNNNEQTARIKEQAISHVNNTENSSPVEEPLLVPMKPTDSLQPQAILEKKLDIDKSKVSFTPVKNPDNQRVASDVDSEKTSNVLKELPNNEENWKQIVHKLELNGMVKELANHCVIATWSDSLIHLIVDEAQKLLLNKRNEERLKQALNLYIGKAISIKITAGQPIHNTPAVLKKNDLERAHEKAQNLIESDVNVKKIISHFDAHIESITAVDN